MPLCREGTKDGGTSTRRTHFRIRSIGTENDDKTLFGVCCVIVVVLQRGFEPRTARL